MALILGARPACVVIDQHDAIRVPVPFEGLGVVVGERVTQHPCGTYCNGRQGHPIENRIHGIVPKTLIDAGAFRLERIITDMVDMVVIDIDIERKPRILQGAGGAGVDAVEYVVQIVAADDGADVTSDHDGSAFHRAAFDRSPGPFGIRVIVDLVIFDAGIVTLVRAAGPVEEDPQLHVVDLVPADHQMRGIRGDTPQPPVAVP